jgi:hypothetical protein
MDDETDKIHVISLSDDWAFAKEQGVETIILHHGDGVTEKIPVSPLEAGEIAQ